MLLPYVQVFILKEAVIVYEGLGARIHRLAWWVIWLWVFPARAMPRKTHKYSHRIPHAMMLERAHKSRGDDTPR